MLYQVIVKQTGHVVANIITYVDIQIGDKLDYVDHKEDQYRGLIVERLILGSSRGITTRPTPEGIFPIGREDVYTIQIIIDQEVPI